jgi:hypothetical protein
LALIEPRLEIVSQYRKDSQPYLTRKGSIEPRSSRFSEKNEAAELTNKTDLCMTANTGSNRPVSLPQGFSAVFVSPKAVGSPICHHCTTGRQS